jgi:hypothetical protein
MLPSSAKHKARRLQNAVCEDIRLTFPGLSFKDVQPALMGEAGVDIQLSDIARSLVPFAIECKNKETLSIWKALDQAAANAKEELLRPAVVFKKNGQPPFIALEWTLFLEILREANRDAKGME